MSRKKISKNAMDEFKFEYAPWCLTTRIHDHENHTDGFTKIPKLEEMALEFLTADCNCINEEDGSAHGDPYTYDEELICLYHAIHRFMETGSREDAFDVYYCYIDIYVNNYTQARKLIEMLSNYENTASNLVLKHRDHYSHSVYVFITGLAIYHSNPNFRNEYQKTYFKGDSVTQEDAALNFLQFWGMTSLFHDVGYPFEIPFEQIKSYFHMDMTGENQGKVKDSQIPFIAYKQMAPFIDLKEILSTIYAQQNSGKTLSEQRYNEYARKLMENSCVDNLDELTIADVIAHHVARRMQNRKLPIDTGAEEYVKDILLTKSGNPNLHNYFMDHALFSSLLLLRRLFDMIGIDQILDHYDQDKSTYYGWMDSLTAIVMHNSLFKFKLRKVKAAEKGEDPISQPLHIHEHPLAYMLMLCDELQCWDRLSYGRDSKKQLHAMNCEFDFDESGMIKATYLFEKDQSAVCVGDGKIESIKDGTFQKFFYSKKDDKKNPIYFLIGEGFCPEPGSTDTWKIELGSKEAAECVFYKDISEIIELTDLKDGGESGLQVAARMEDNCRYRDHSLSDIKLINIYDYAEKLYSKLHEDKFEDQALSTKISYIQIVKNMADYLDEIEVFYSDEPKALSQKHLKDFTLAEKRYLALLEMERERTENIQMCRGGISWEYLTYLNENPARGAAHFREMYAEKLAKVQGQGQSEPEKALIDVKEPEKLVNAFLELLDEECNIYYYPGKKLYDLIYSEESIRNILQAQEKGEETDYWPDLVQMKDLKGRIIKEYTQGQFLCEEAVDDWNTTEESVQLLYLVHLKEFYREYPLTEEDSSGEEPIFWYQLGEDNHNAKLRLELYPVYDEERDQTYGGTRLIYEEEIQNGDRTYRKEKELDRTTYYFEEDENHNKDYGRIFFRQVPEGCIDVFSWLVEQLDETL